VFSEDAKAPVRKQSIKIGRSDSAQNLIRQLSYLLSRHNKIIPILLLCYAVISYSIKLCTSLLFRLLVNSLALIHLKVKFSCTGLFIRWLYKVRVCGKNALINILGHSLYCILYKGPKFCSLTIFIASRVSKEAEFYLDFKNINLH
jgi:hypothetical protein